MIHYIDARGKQCPIPVVETKKVLAHVRPGDIIETAVDNEIAVQNLEKMAVQKKLAFSHRTEGERHYVVSLSMTAEGGKDRDTNGENTSGAEAAGEKEEFLCRPCVQGETVVVLSSDKMGEGDEALGKVLMKGFIYALTSQEILPDTVLLYNSGAKLSVEGSDSLEDLKLLESQGVEILTCGTCLNHYGLTEKLAAGSVTNMYDICHKMMSAAKVIKP